MLTLKKFFSFDMIYNSFPYCNHRHYDYYSSSINYYLNCKKIFCRNNQKISCIEIKNYFLAHIVSIDNKINEKNIFNKFNKMIIEIPFKFCPCIPILFQTFLFWRIYYLLNNNQYQKTFYDLYLCQYIVFTDVYKKHKLAYRNQKHKSICNKYSIQLYTRKLTKNLFQLCCSYINKEFDFKYCNKYKKVNISNTKTKKQIYWVEHYNEKNYSYNITNIKIYNFDEINENIEKK